MDKDITLLGSILVAAMGIFLYFRNRAPQEPVLTATNAVQWQAQYIEEELTPAIVTSLPPEEIEGPPVPGAGYALSTAALDRLPSGDRWNVNTWWNRFHGDNQLHSNYFPSMVEMASKYGVPLSLVCAIIAQESGGDPTVHGKADDIGLMQILPPTAADMGFTGTMTQLFDPRVNIEYGTKYLSKQLTRYYGIVSDAIAAYNAGSVIRFNDSTLTYTLYSGSWACPAQDRLRYIQGGIVTNCVPGPYNVNVAGAYVNEYTYAYPVLNKYGIFNQVIVRI